MSAEVAFYQGKPHQKINYLAGNISNINDYRKSSLGKINDQQPIDISLYRDKKRNPSLNVVEKEPQDQGLADEISDITRNGEGEMYLLPGTGFQVKSQVDLLLENYKNNVPISDTLQQLEQDIQGFKTEYLCELPVFPIVLEKRNEAGKRFLTGKLYGGRSFADAISADEREGVVKASAQKVEGILLDAEPGTVVVMTSPKGWSGYQSRDNRLEKLNPFDVSAGRASEITYPDTQTYCYQVMKDGSIKGFTLKTDMSLPQNKRLLMELGVSEDVFQDEVGGKTDIKRIVSNVVKIDPEKNESIEGIAQKIRHIKTSEIAYVDSGGVSRSFSEMVDLLQHPENLWTLDASVKSVVDPLLAYVSKRITEIDGGRRGDLEIALGLTVLKLMDKVRPGKKDIKLTLGEVYVPNREPGFLSFNPFERLKELQKIGGCAGGGKNEKSIIESVAPRVGEVANNNSQEWFTCPKCSYKADGPIGNTCPGCNLTKEEYAAEEGAVVCD